MKRKLSTYCICFVLITVIGNCSKIRIWTSSPVIQIIENDYFEAELEPALKMDEKFFDAFRLVVRNKSDRNLVIDWVKTRYIYEGKITGGFAFKGLAADNINRPPAVTVSAGETFERMIWPVKLIGFERLRSSNVKAGESGLNLGLLPAGENGILLVVSVDDKEIREKIMLNIEVTEISKY
ncbi:MAG: hypothetical protein JRH18_03360 [Deltaproteobacteria bacterium]|nr:hypothetical protein [Deltaproteobacteria bacterium]MBW2150687.1 hypothetical protein [Deltaproteobacteria bacterium]